MDHPQTRAAALNYIANRLNAREQAEVIAYLEDDPHLQGLLSVSLAARARRRGRHRG